MKKIFFLFAMLVSVTASAQTLDIKITTIDYAKKVATCDISWTGRDATHLSDVWVFVDYVEISGDALAGSWTPAAVTGATVTQNTTGNATVATVSGNTRGVWIKSVTSGANFTGQMALQLNGVPAKFNACAYASDYPPNAAITTAGYQLKGSPPFTITYNNSSSTITANKTFALGCINVLTDATGCPGLVEALSAPTGSVNGSRCNAGTVQISATPPAGCTIDWYTTASGAVTVANGTGVTTLTTPSISTTTNYYAASRHLITGCVSSSRRTVTATVMTGSGRDAAPNSCGCASGLTVVGGYCRDLVADKAKPITCYSSTGGTLEVKSADEGRVKYVNRNICPTGWHVPSFAELRCIWAARSSLNLNLSYRYWSSSTTGYDTGCSSGSNMSVCRYFLCTQEGNCGNTWVYQGDMIYCCGNGCIAYNGEGFVRCVR
ncbi:MAG: hypothetical protein LBN98_04540 [Prevotellaceae bacterium]|jgi:hypothetical protein|nr:hypothetical protein [Prevotellaceae bacterium]